jgi:DNA processing protein
MMTTVGRAGSEGVPARSPGRHVAGDRERTAWLALAATPGVGAATLARLVTVHAGPAAALDAVSRLSGPAGDRELAARLGLRRVHGLADALQAAARRPDAVERRMTSLGGWCLTPYDAGYPEAFSELADPPAVLFGLGHPGRLAGTRSVAVVGTRRPTPQGRSIAARVTTRLVEAGADIISGLAVGIDAVAHRAALDAGGRTLAVVGSGLDDPGPRANRALARRMLEQDGAIVSELAPGVPPTAGTFPRRNRLISILAGATCVVEAPARSGALITARHALEQGRTLVVAPGRPMDLATAGCLALLRETPARPLVGLDEMLVDLGLDAATAPDSHAPAGRLSADAALALLGPAEREVAAALRGGPATLDGLAARTGLVPGAVAAALTLLEMRGWAAPHGSVYLAAGPLLASGGGST